MHFSFAFHIPEYFTETVLDEETLPTSGVFMWAGEMTKLLFSVGQTPAKGEGNALLECMQIMKYFTDISISPYKLRSHEYGDWYSTPFLC